MKTLLSLVTVLVSLAIAQAQEMFTVSLDAGQEVPAFGGRTGTGMGMLTLNLDGTVTYNITYSGLSGSFSAAHIHGIAGRGTNAGVIFGLVNTPSGPNAGTLMGTTPSFSAAQIAAMRNEFTYVNIHSTPTFTGGEIRGQITPVPEPSTFALMGLGAGALLVWLRRRNS